MKLLFTALLVLATAVGFTMLAQRDPGYVLISYSDWSVESSLSPAFKRIQQCRAANAKPTF